MELYSPPGNGIPQELPDRWRFANGEVRYDLNSLSNYDLSLLDWVGPFPQLVPKQLDEDGNPVSEDYDYDPETHKVAWYKYFRKYIILEKHVNELPYQDGELVSEVDRPDWKKFQGTAVALPELNAYIAQLLPICPLVAISIPTTVRDLVNGSYGEFTTIWNTISQFIAPPDSLIKDIIALAKECRLPNEFIDVFKNK
jgi:hypothetical protein